MRFRPSDRISTSQALDMIRSISDSANTGEEAKDKMDEAKDEMDEAKDEMDEAEDGMDDRGLSTLSSYLCITPADARVEVA
jgi:methyl-accepting chemotaxis protein